MITTIVTISWFGTFIHSRSKISSLFKGKQWNNIRVIKSKPINNKCLYSVQVFKPNKIETEIKFTSDNPENIKKYVIDNFAQEANYLYILYFILFCYLLKYIEDNIIFENSIQKKE